MSEHVISQWTDAHGRTYRDVSRDGVRVCQVLCHFATPTWMDWEVFTRTYST